MRQQWLLPAIFGLIAVLIVVSAMKWYRGSQPSTPPAVLTTPTAPPVLPPAVAEPPVVATLPTLKAQSQGVEGDTPDAELAAIFTAIRQDEWELALSLTNALIDKYPNYRLAYLIRGDLFMAKSTSLSSVNHAGEQGQVDDLRAEALVRLKAYHEKPPNDRLPAYLLQLAPQQTHAIVVDTLRSRLYVFGRDAGEIRLLRDYYVTQGKLGAGKSSEGDKRTPIGVYHITQELPRANLGPLYGDGAFPLNYPNEWDRLQRRGGSGIWLHGTPVDTFARPPKASDGCIVLTNRDLNQVRSWINPGLTPVVVAHGVEWAKPSELNAERDNLLRQLSAWKNAWQSRDSKSYLSFYAPEFKSPEGDFRAFAAHKTQVLAARQWIKIALSDTTLLAVPPDSQSGAHLAVVEFTQDYRSDSLSEKMRKRQYWLEKNGEWRIVYEGKA